MSITNDMEAIDERGASVRTHLFGSGYEPVPASVVDPMRSVAPNTQLARSPFAGALTTVSAENEARDDFARLVGELYADEFEHGFRAVVNEAAARHLSSLDPMTEMELGSIGSAETWISRLASESDRMLEALETQLGERNAADVTQEDFELAAGRSLDEGELLGDATEQFLGGLVKKAGNFVKKAASVVGRFVPIGPFIGILRKLVRPLLMKALSTAINRLPPNLRPIATQLRRKLMGGPAARAGVSGAGTPRPASAAPPSAPDAAATQPGDEPTDDASAPADPAAAAVSEFDEQLAAALLAPSSADLDEVVSEAEASASEMGTEPLRDLDRARDRLQQQLAAAEPGVPPQEALEQFLPVAMAAMPLARQAFKVLGRQRVINFVAPRLAVLIKDHIGPAAAKRLSRHLTDVGLRSIGLEAPADQPRAMEAMVATVEETLQQMAQLPDEALESPLQLEAELQEAFTAAAAAHLPGELLRDDLADDEAFVWTMMPRLGTPAFRYKKCGRIFPVTITRPMARGVIYTEGESLESRLLDAGVRTWPVAAEVHLYEGLPGANVGHLAAFETESSLADTALAAEEFEHLTPDRAAVLLGRPQLGRPAPRAPGAFGPGTRMFRVAVPGRRLRRRRPRIVLRLDGPVGATTLTVHLRLRERESLEVSRLLAQNAHVQIAAMFKHVVGSPQRAGLARRLARQAQRTFGRPIPLDAASRLGNSMADAMLSTIAKQLQGDATAFSAATKDPAVGTTLAFAFPATDLFKAPPAPPTMKIAPGWRRA